MYNLYFNNSTEHELIQYDSLYIEWNIIIEQQKNKLNLKSEQLRFLINNYVY